MPKHANKCQPINFYSAGCFIAINKVQKKISTNPYIQWKIKLLAWLFIIDLYNTNAVRHSTWLQDTIRTVAVRNAAIETTTSAITENDLRSKHERFVPSDTNHPQLSLGIQTESIETGTVVNTQKISYIKNTVAVEQKRLNHPGRMKLPESLRREEIIIEPSADITDCKKMGEEITEVLEYQPGELFVK